MSFDATEFFTQEDLTTATVLPYAQWLNSSAQKFGLAIKDEQAEIAEFKPDGRWEKIENVELGEDVHTMWVAKNPRLICLNIAEVLSSSDPSRVSILLMHHKQTGEKCLFDKERYYADKENWTPYRPFYFIPVGENNELLSAPFVLNIKKASMRTLVDVIEKQWKPSLISAYKNAGAKIPAGQKLTATWFAHNVFEPVIHRGKIGSGSLSSNATLCEKFSPIDLSKVAISRKHVSSPVITEYCHSVKDFLKEALKTEKKEDKAVEAINIDDFTNAETGEVNLPEHLLDALPF